MIKANVKNTKNTKNMDIYIIRKVSDEIRFSKPCKHCLETLQKCNIKRIYYSVYGNDYDDHIYYKMEKGRDMKTTHSSYGAKKFYGY